MSAPVVQLCSWTSAVRHAWHASDADRTGATPIDATLLVVDDDARVRRLTVRMLRDEGYRVLEAGSGREALGLLASEREVRLVVTDIVMPGMHGIELAEAILALHPTRRVVLMSGYAPNLLDEFGLHESRFPLLMKPFTAEQLARQIRILLEPSH